MPLLALAGKAASQFANADGSFAVYTARPGINRQLQAAAKVQRTRRHPSQAMQ